MKPNSHAPVDQQRYQDTSQAFDSVAPVYEGPLGNNVLVQQMRAVLWRTVERLAPAGGCLLDLGCGVGLDAVHFAQQGYRVTALDHAPEMVAQARQRAEKARVTHQLTPLVLGIHELERLAPGQFDVIYSDLGALNCLPELKTVAPNCAGMLKPGGRLVFSVIGRLCPWELAYYCLRLDFRRAGVRFASGQVAAPLNGLRVWTRYYFPGEFYREFGAFFTRDSCLALNLFLPPPYLAGFYQRHPSLGKALSWLDEHAGALPVLNQAGDHFLIVMSRRE